MYMYIYVMIKKNEISLYRGLFTFFSFLIIITYIKKKMNNMYMYIYVMRIKNE